MRAETAKSGFERRVPILPRSEKVLRGFRRHSASADVLHKAHGRPVPGIRKLMQMLPVRAEIPLASRHDLRRTCERRLFQAHKLKMHAVADWLGHTSVTQAETTYEYLRVDDLHEAVGTQRG